MKKIIGIAVALLMTTGLFAKTWTNNIGVGFTVPITMVEAKKDIFPDGDSLSAKRTFTSYGVQGMYLGYHENGFTVKGAFDLTFGSWEKAYEDSDGWQDVVNICLSETLGVGYSFVHSDSVVLAATAGIGLSSAIAPYKYTVITEEHDVTLTSTTFNLGADLTGIIRTSPKFGFYGSIYVGWIPFGTAKIEDKVEIGNTSTTNTDSWDLKGNMFIAPTIGVVWTF